MPFKSRSQKRWMFAAEARGEVPEGTARRWQAHTKDKDLPERVKKASLTEAFIDGVLDGLEKQALREPGVEDLTGPYGQVIKLLHRLGHGSGSTKTLSALERLSHNVPSGQYRSSHFE